MKKTLKNLVIFGAVAMFVIALAGCGGGPNEEELQMLEETKAAALAAEEAQADCEATKEELNKQLAQAKQDLEDMQQEKEDVSNRLAAM